jgi:carotenoid cleavage dioxygenase
VIGEIPKRLSGVYLRNTQNAPLHEPLGTYHAFDGDGMLHLMSFDNGRCEYRNRYIRTAGLMEEQQAGHALYAGLIDKPALAQRPGWGARGGLKDTSATDVIVHAGKALTMFYQCGEPYRLDARTLAAQGVSGWGAQVLPDGGFRPTAKWICAAATCCSSTTASKRLTCTTARWMQATSWCTTCRCRCPARACRTTWPSPSTTPSSMTSRCTGTKPCWPRASTSSVTTLTSPRAWRSCRAGAPQTGIRWFEATPTYVLHWLNAWEEGDEIVLHGYHQKTPMPKAGYDNTGQTLGPERYGPTLYEWRLNLKTGQTRERRLDERCSSSA